MPIRAVWVTIFPIMSIILMLRVRMDISSAKGGHLNCYLLPEFAAAAPLQIPIYLRNTFIAKKKM